MENKIKEYKKNKPVDIELLHRDPNSLNKVLDSELNNIRDHTTRITKLVNYYKNKINEASNVIKTMEEELNNYQIPKTIVLIPKLNYLSENTILYNKNEMQVNQKSIIQFDPKLSNLKEKINKNKDIFLDYNQQIEHYSKLNEKIIEDNEEKKKLLSEKYDFYCKLEIELDNLKKFKKI